MWCENCGLKVDTVYMVPKSKKDIWEVCPECMYENHSWRDPDDGEYVECANCGEELKIDDECVRAEDGTCWCMKCVEDNATHCSDFAEYVWGW